MDSKKTIGLAADHAGFHLKERIKEHLQAQGFEIKDFGTDSDASCDYPDYAHPLGKAVDSQELKTGISVCGSGNGISMVLNKYPKVRAALAWSVDLARLARSHNDANILSLPARFISEDEALKMVDIFLDTDFEGGRHERRVKKIPIPEK